jgi:2-polyprenyl-3-methyl-5-hydroxy-6-metoxy-1,4-benzoquinol methylase
MQRQYWEKIAPAYNEEIFDVLQNDEKAFIRSAIKRIASTGKTVIDAGCAIGKWLPVLSPLFKKVIATDISAKNLAIAAKTHTRLTNIEYRRMDMSAGKLGLLPSDAIVCINAVLSASLKKRQAFFHNLSSCLKKSGHLILVVPSLESWLLTRIIQHQWQIDKELFAERVTGKEAAKRYRDIRQGNVEIDSVATKHYLKEELQLLLSKESLELTAVKKIEYGWNTEFLKPPKWLQQPKPWDWMVTAIKK